jgi:hypothetical protein
MNSYKEIARFTMSVLDKPVLPWRAEDRSTPVAATPAAPLLAVAAGRRRRPAGLLALAILPRRRFASRAAALLIGSWLRRRRPQPSPALVTEGSPVRERGLRWG